MSQKISLLYPDKGVEGKKLSETAIHDIGMDSIIEKLTDNKKERDYIASVMRVMTSDPKTVQYRCDIFDDIFNNKKLRGEIIEVFEQINFMKEYSGTNRGIETNAGAFDLLQRMNDIGKYISCIESLYRCLNESEIKSEGLQNLKEYISELYNDNGFMGMKKDIASLRADTSNVKSITVGINLNEAYEADSIGIVSLNDKYFTRSGILTNFLDHMKVKEDQISHGNTWDEEYNYEPFDMRDKGASDDGNLARAAVFNPLALETLLKVPDSDESIRGITSHMNEIADQLLKKMVHRLKSVLDRYSMITITDVTGLMPEFIYYIRWAEYIEKLMAAGFSFTRPVCSDKAMDARGLYNLKLASLDGKSPEDVVVNDMDFSDEHRVWLLTGANRGGKTTVTQAVGQLFFMAEGGIYAPAESFEFTPVDSIYTHFPADEDKTMELGRLGEECRRFKSIYEDATDKSLILLNETFSTTSFEEGYYIARDSVRAMLKKGCRVIYNTHMHKLAHDKDEINEASGQYKAESIVMESGGGVRSYKLKIAPPEGISYAMDIARKYGVTYEDLVLDRADG